MDVKVRWCGDGDGGGRSHSWSVDQLFFDLRSTTFYSNASYRIHSSSAGFLNHSCSVTNTAMAGIYPEPIPKREDIDDLMKSFDTIPLFMQDMPEDDNVAMEALQSLVHDGTPDG